MLSRLSVIFLTAISSFGLLQMLMDNLKKKKKKEMRFPFGKIND
jgi:FtsZ-binding cell division protein ZapB